MAEPRGCSGHYERQNPLNVSSKGWQVCLPSTRRSGVPETRSECGCKEVGWTEVIDLCGCRAYNCADSYSKADRLRRACCVEPSHSLSPLRRSCT